MSCLFLHHLFLCVQVFLSFCQWSSGWSQPGTVLLSLHLTNYKTSLLPTKHTLSYNKISERCNLRFTHLESLLLSFAHRVWPSPPTCVCYRQINEQSEVVVTIFIMTVNLLYDVLNWLCCIKSVLLLSQLLCIFLGSCWNTSILFAPNIRFLNKSTETGHG